MVALRYHALCWLITFLLTTTAALHPDVHDIMGRIGKRATTAVVAPTYVYVPTTLANGVVQTVAVIYVQTFSPVATAATAISAGVIGMPTGAAATASANAATTEVPHLNLVATVLAMLLCSLLGFLL